MRTCLRTAAILAEAVGQTGRYFLVSLGLLVTRRPGGQRRAARMRMRGRCLADFCMNLGPAFIKLGQILSARPDLLPPLVVEELQTLQDKVPPFPFAEARAIIEADLGPDGWAALASIDPVPVAAASIAQVHSARLQDGSHVAVKVQRPDIEDVISRDLAILRMLVLPLKLIPGGENLAATQMMDEVGSKIRAQLDFPREVNNNRRFSSNLADLPFVRLPRIVPELCGPRVITMEFIEGVKLTDALDDPPVPGPVLADRIVDIYLSMAFRHFFVHADLHPGNIFVDDEGRLVLLDTGLVHEVPAHYVRKFFRAYLSLMALDGTALMDAYLEGLDVPESTRRSAERAAQEFLDKYAEADFRDIQLGKVLVEAFGLLRKHRIFLDPEFTGFFLSELTFEGIAKRLDSEIDLAEVVPSKMPRFVSDHDFLEPDDPIVASLLARIERDGLGLPPG